MSSLGISTSWGYWNPTRLSRSVSTGGGKYISFSIIALLLESCTLTASYISIRMIICVIFPFTLFFTHLITCQTLFCTLPISRISSQKCFVFTLLIVLPLQFLASRYSLHVSSDCARVNLLYNTRVSCTDRWYSGVHQDFTYILGRAHGIKRSITLWIAVVKVSTALSISISDSRGWLFRRVTSSVKILLNFSLFIIFHAFRLYFSCAYSVTSVWI